MSRPVTAKTCLLAAAMLAEEERVAGGGEPDTGFRSRLAARAGVSRQRIHGIAKRYGLRRLDEHGRIRARS